MSRKVRVATILGTIQSSYTNFPYLREIWRKNTEEERLLGVSLTGIMDAAITTEKNEGLAATLEALKEVAVLTNVEFAHRLQIPVSAAITCVKPSGTVSQLTDAASGIHPRHSAYYIRTVRGSNNDPLTKFMKASGVLNEPEKNRPNDTTVFSFPTKAPEGATVNKDLTAIEHLKTWLIYQRHWCEHKPSVTISVRKDEWLEVGQFVFEHFDEISGISFLPLDEHVYEQAPYQEIDEEEYNETMKNHPTVVNWELLSNYETEDKTVSAQTFACVGSCEEVDIS